jgi:hypothetical protein
MNRASERIENTSNIEGIKVKRIDEQLDDSLAKLMEWEKNCGVFAKSTKYTKQGLS